MGNRISCCCRQQQKEEASSFEEIRLKEKEEEFPCSHYFRFCYVYMPCCETWWSCHRCHNASNTCNNNKSRAKEVTHLKCKLCDHVQQFPTTSPVKCVRCNVRFAEYECLKCHQLCGYIDHPKHCDKCGLCRIHSHRSFHCDKCGICLDIKLFNNHKCDETRKDCICPICLESTFTGCVMLPCHHLIHRECAVQLFKVLNKARCPTCRISFKINNTQNGTVIRE